MSKHVQKTKAESKKTVKDTLQQVSYKLAAINISKTKNSQKISLCEWNDNLLAHESIQSTINNKLIAQSANTAQLAPPNKNADTKKVFVRCE